MNGQHLMMGTHRGGDEMFAECLDQQPGLKPWMTANGVADYNALQQYFTKRLRASVLPQLSPQPPIVVWEQSGSLPIADRSVLTMYILITIYI